MKSPFFTQAVIIISMNLTNILYLALLIMSFNMMAQAPKLVTSPDESRENVEAEVLEADTINPIELIKCSFKLENKGSFILKFLSSGQDDLIIRIGKNVTRMSPNAYYGSSYQVYENYYEVTKYSSDYSDFLDNFIAGFAKKGKSEFLVYACQDDVHNWSREIKGYTHKDIAINLKAYSKKRSNFGQFWAYLGLSVSESPELVSQSYHFMNDSQNFWTDLSYLKLNNDIQLMAAAAYAEKMTGSISFGDEKAEFTNCSSSNVLPHFAGKRD